MLSASRLCQPAISDVTDAVQDIAGRRRLQRCTESWQTVTDLLFYSMCRYKQRRKWSVVEAARRRGESGENCDFKGVQCCRWALHRKLSIRFSTLTSLISAQGECFQTPQNFNRQLLERPEQPEKPEPQFLWTNRLSSTQPRTLFCSRVTYLPTRTRSSSPIWAVTQK